MESCSTGQTSLVAFSDTAGPAGTLSGHLSTGHEYYPPGRGVDSHLHADVDDRFSAVFCGLHMCPDNQTSREDPHTAGCPARPGWLRAYRHCERTVAPLSGITDHRLSSAGSAASVC